MISAYSGDPRRDNVVNVILTTHYYIAAGEEWRELDDSEKMPYEKKSQEGQKIYEAKMVEYRKVKNVTIMALETKFLMESIAIRERE